MDTWHASVKAKARPRPLHMLSQQKMPDGPGESTIGPQKGRGRERREWNGGGRGVDNSITPLPFSVKFQSEV